MKVYPAYATRGDNIFQGVQTLAAGAVPATNGGAALGTTALAFAASYFRGILSDGNLDLGGNNTNYWRVLGASGNLIAVTSNNQTFGWGTSGLIDTGFTKLGTGVVGVGTGVAGDVSGTLRAAVVRTGTSLVAGLPAAATAGAGARAFVTDATVTWAAGIGTIVVGGGTNSVPVGSDGTNWRVG